jgi:hypothetical protein
MIADVLERECAEFDLPMAAWEAAKPHGVSGCFRLRSEAEFMRLAVESHLPWLDEAVLVVQPSVDRTFEIACALAAEYAPKVRVVVYPFDVFPVGSPQYRECPENSVRSMVHLTNWAIAQCRYSWVAKIEGDVIAMPDFGRIRLAVDQHREDVAYYGRVGLNVAGPDGKEFPPKAPRNAGWDEGVFNNHPVWHAVKAEKWETMNLHENRDKLRNGGWSFFHVKRCKAKHQRLRDQEKWQPLAMGILTVALSEYQARYPYPGPEGTDLPPALTWGDDGE